MRRSPLAALVLGLLLAGGGALAAHPIHSTLTQITHDRATRTATVSVRVFADDFGTAIRRLPGARAAPFDAAALAYARRTLTLTAPGGKPLPLRWCGARRAGEVVWLCLRAPAPGGLRGVAVHNRMHFELFSDQVNVVQAVSGRRRQSVVFTPGSSPRPLR